MCQPEPSVILSPVSQPLALRFLSVTFETPSAEIATPLNSFGFPSLAPMSQAPRPSIVTPDFLTTIGPYAFCGSSVVSAVISSTAGRSPPAHRIVTATSRNRTQPGPQPEPKDVFRRSRNSGAAGWTLASIQ